MSRLFADQQPHTHNGIHGYDGKAHSDGFPFDTNSIAVC